MARKAKDSTTTETAANVVSLPTKKRVGEKHVPTNLHRNTVMVGCLSGMTQAQIAGMLEIDPKTLRAHYNEELTSGRERMLAKVASNLFSIATQNADLKASLTASIFILKTQGGWRENAEKKDEENVGKNVVVSLNIGDKEPKTA